MKAFILLSLFALAVAKECGENQHYESCGTACPLTCENYQNPPKFCILMCNPGCHCDKGYVKAKDGSCVKPEQCEAQAVCGENERYSECGTACPLTCDNFDNPPKICPLMCVQGCECEKGFVRNFDGRCVRPEQCPSKTECGENAHFETCGTACPLTCTDYQHPKFGCVQRCNIGCHCDKGYVKRRDGRCVRPEQCFSRALADICSLPAKTGICMAHFPSYFYNAETGKCERFIYGGCGGNENRFETVEECEKACGSS